MSLESLKNRWDEYLAFLRKNKSAMNDWELSYVKKMWNRRQEGKILTLHESFELRRIHHEIDFRTG